MKKSLNRIYLLIFLTLFLSCAEEDMNLVNPPSQTEYVRVRFLNLSGNKQDATLILDGSVQIGPVAYGVVSGAVKPPSDSSFASVVQGGQQVYRLNRKIRFIRNNYYTVIGLPSSPSDTSLHRDFDTLIVASTLSGLPLSEYKAYLRIFNAVPDSNRNYTLRLGCPNGDPIASNIQYRKMSAQVEVRSDGVPVSIIRTDNGKSEVIGLFNLDLEQKKQYMIIAHKANDGSDKEELFLLDEYNESADPVTMLIPETKLTTEIRAINLSESNVTFIKHPDSTLVNGIFENLSSKKIGNYISVSACGGETPDTLAALIGTDTASSITTSLEVAEKYTLMTFDSAQAKAKTSILAEPYRIDFKGKAAIRVVHAAYKMAELIVSMAARDDNPYSNERDSLGYRSGDLVSNKIQYGSISSPMLITPGDNLPITIFTTTQPARLINTSIASLKGGNKYLLVLTNDFSSGEDLLYLIEDNDGPGTMLEPLAKGVLAQFVNLVPGVDYLKLSVGPVLTNAKLSFRASLATVISEGQHRISINNKDTTIDAKSGERILFVFAGDDTSTDFLAFSYSPMLPYSGSYKKRYINASKENRHINASKEISMISIKENSDGESNPFTRDNIKYGESSKPDSVSLDRNLSLFFIDSENKKTLYRIDDMPFPFGKNYTLIFGGRSKDKSYSVVVQQEY